MNTSCPSCGAQTSGKFCQACGTPVLGARCASCGATGSPGQSFCNKCGAAMGSARSIKTPWLISMAAAAVLIVVFFFGIRAPGAPGAPASGGAMAFDPMVGTTDISQLTPEQSASMLFDRVMRGREGGDAEEVAFFGPMAIQSYEMLDSLGADARYHMGLLYSAIGEAAPILVQADLLQAAIPGHLFVFMLRGEAAQAMGDREGLQSAYRGFLSNYDVEMAAARREYQEHQATVGGFLEEATAAGGSP